MRILIGLFSGFVFIGERLYLIAMSFIEKKLNVLFLLAFRNRFGNKTSIGRNVRIGVGCHWRTGRNTELIFGDNVLIGDNCSIELKDNAKLIIGDNSYIGPNSEIFTMEKIEIGESTLVAQRCMIIDYNHKWDKDSGVKRKEFNSSPIRIGSRTWLGANVIVLSGSVIEDRCLIGAGAIVRGRVETGQKYIGRPERE